MNNTFEHNRNILNSINSFNLLEKARHNAPRNNKQITNLNPSNLPQKQRDNVKEYIKKTKKEL